MAEGKKSTVQIAAELAEPVLSQMGLTLWDVTFAKEGSVWVLRYLVDKEGGININECEEFSRAVEERLDQADPIQQSYTLEVSSPGVERELTRDWHFEALMGQLLSVRLIRPVEGVRDFVGTLTGYQDGEITLLLDDDLEMAFRKSEAAYVLSLIHILVSPTEDNGGQSSRLLFYGSSFITDATGELTASAGRDQEEVLLATVDLDAAARLRLDWGLYRDRRPHCYSAVTREGSVQY